MMAKTMVPLVLVVLGAAAVVAKPSAREKPRLSTGAWLDPAGVSSEVGQMPLQIVLAPGGGRLLVSLGGWREQGIQVVDRAGGRVLQTLPQKAAFYGLAISPDAKTLYASGGNEDVVYRYAWSDGAARPDGVIVLGTKDPGKDPTSYPAGLALSPDGRRLYVAENIADSLAVVDVQDGKVLQRLPTGHYPYDVRVGPDGVVYVSAWGSSIVSLLAPTPGGSPLLETRGAVEVGRHPSGMALAPAGDRLYVACASVDAVYVVDTHAARVVARLDDPAPAGPHEGSTPNAVALSGDGRRLFVAEADANAVAVFDLSRRGGVLAGRIPVGWYPTGVLTDADALLVLDGKGLGSAPSLAMAQPGPPLDPTSKDYSLGQLRGALTIVPQVARAELAPLTRRVAAANGWDAPRRAPRYPRFKHVVYIIKENRTYDQILGDVAAGDGDASLVFFPRPVTPNHHALAARFGLYDRFFTNAEVSAQGHSWSTAAYVPDYMEKMTPQWYSDRRPERDEDGVEDPANGYLWTLAAQKGKSVRVYGELAEPVEGANPPRYTSSRRDLRAVTSPIYPSFDMTIPDQRRVDAWLLELHGFEAKGDMPALEILHLPSDHTAGARPGLRTPRATMADNDLALGRLVEGLSRSRFWKDTVVFVVEDDAQAGPDHVDAHRSVLLTISAYSRPGTRRRFVNTTDVVATVEEILGLGRLSQFDHFGRPLRESFAPEPDLSPYVALGPEVSLDELNVAGGSATGASGLLDLSAPDASDDDLMNRVLWTAIKGEGVPYPGPRHAALPELSTR